MKIKDTLRSVLLSSIIIMGVLYTVVYTSCKPDLCKAIACAHGGTCDQGACKCLPGYEGTNCETVNRDKYIGFWQIKEQGSISPLRQYPVSIERDSVVTNVLIKNLYNYFSSEKVKAYVHGDTLIIPNQQLMGKVVFGKGYIHSTAKGNNNVITMSYEVIDVPTQMVDDFGFYTDLDMSKPSEWSKQ